MKTKMQNWMVVYASVLMLTALPLAADQQDATTAKPDKTYTGTVISVSPNERMLHVRGLIFSKDFNLGDNCGYALLDPSAGGMAGLRDGEKIKISYQSARGVLVADRVQQIPMACEGTVAAVDPATKTLTLHRAGMDKTFLIPDDCKIVLHDNKSGTIDRVQPGNDVTVTYETPNGKLVAHQIAQTSATYTGQLTAIDSNDRIVKAKGTFGSKQFNVAADCAIVVNGKTTGQLSDLKIGDRLEFSYDDVNGVNVVNRIGVAPAQPSETASSQPMMQ